MALKKSSDIPEDAIKFNNETEAAAYIWEVVYDWKTFSQTWALKYGPVTLGGINAVCGLMINKYYRRRFKLGVLGQFSSALPVFAMPALLTTLFHNYLVPTDILLMKSKPCPICYEVKSVIIQCGFGFVYPMVLGPTAALMFANMYGTFRVPDLREGPRVMFNFLRKHTKPFTGTLAYIAAFQIAAASFVTYFELQNNHVLKQEILELERKLDESHGDWKSLKD